MFLNCFELRSLKSDNTSAFIKMIKMKIRTKIHCWTSHNHLLTQKMNTPSPTNIGFGFTFAQIRKILTNKILFIVIPITEALNKPRIIQLLICATIVNVVLTADLTIKVLLPLLILLAGKNKMFTITTRHITS